MQSTGSVSNISEVKLSNFEDRVLGETNSKEEPQVDE